MESHPKQNAQEEKMEDDMPEATVTTLMLVGKTGVGKSTFASACLGLSGSEGFQASSSIRSCTEVSTQKTGFLLGLKKLGWLLRVQDTPGLFDTAGRDDGFLKDFVETMQKELKYLHKFCFVMNS